MADDDLPPYRVCDLCGQVDRHPRHSFTGVFLDEHPVDESISPTVEASLNELVEAKKIGVGDAIRIGKDFWDTTSTDRHIDCCATAGCPKAGTADGCDARVAVWNGKTGKGMVEAAMKVREKNAKHFAPPADDDDQEA